MLPLPFLIILLFLLILLQLLHLLLISSPTRSTLTKSLAWPTNKLLSLPLPSPLPAR